MGALFLILALIFFILGYPGLAVILLVIGLVFFLAPGAPAGRWPYRG